MAEDTKKRNSRQYNWQKENTDRINFTMPKGKKERIKEQAELSGLSATVWIKQAIDEKFQAEGVGYKEAFDLSSIQDLEAYARSSGKTSAEYVREAIWEKMERQDAEYTEEGPERIVLQ